MKKRLICLSLVLSTLLGVLFITPLSISAEVISSGSRLPFADVAEGSWYYEGASFCYNNNIIKGQGNATTFAPGVNVTRASFVVMLARTAGADTSMYTESRFTDCKASWYIPSVEWAAEEGYVNGTGEGVFSPDKTMTRQEVAALLSRFMQSRGYDVTVAEGTIEGYIDHESISSWATEGMEYLISSGIMTSTSQAKPAASPKMTLTRAQAALIFERFMRNYFHGGCEHSFVEASCTEGEYCTLCGMVTSLPRGHVCEKLSCNEGDICKVCSAQVPPDTGLHEYAEATCTLPETCIICGATRSKASGHKFIPATCQTPETCSVCKETRGEANEHSTDNGICKYCGIELFASDYDKVAYHMTANGVFDESKGTYVCGRFEYYDGHVGYTQITYYPSISAFVFAYEYVAYKEGVTMTLQITIPQLSDTYNYTVNYYETSALTCSAHGSINAPSLALDSDFVLENFSGNSSNKEKVCNMAKQALGECMVQTDLLLDGICGIGLAAFNFVNIKWN